VSALLALAVGYFLGVRSGRSDLDRLRRALTALYGTDEFGEVVAAARAQVGGTLHDLASIIAGNGIEGDGRLPDDAGDTGDTGDLVARVRNLVGRD
jgi:hypothetical protein